MLRIELRRVPTRWLTPLWVALAAFLVFNCLRPGVFLWADIDYGFSEVRAGFDPLVAGVAAWEAGRRLKSGFWAQTATASRSRFRAVGAHVVATLAWPVAGWLAALAGYAVAAALAGVYGGPDPAWMVASLASAVAAGVFGYLVGLLGRGFWAVPPIAALFSYLAWQLLFDRSSGWASLLNPTSITQNSAFDRMYEPTFWAQAGWYIAASLTLFCAVVFTAARGRDAKALVAGLLALTLAVGSVGALATTNGQTVYWKSNPVRVCLGKAPVICVLPGFQKGVPEIRRYFVAYNARAAGTTLVAERLVQQGDSEGGKAPAGTTWFNLDDLSPGGFSDMIPTYLDDITRTEFCGDEHDFANEVVISWLAPDPSLLVGDDDGPGSDQIRAWEQRSDRSKNRWLRTHVTQFENCALRYSDLG